MKIGFFDSGIGGLTVLYEALKQIPNQDYIYYADTVHAPYGPKPKDEVRQYVFEAIEFLVNQGAEIIVIACNTATSIAVADLRINYSIPIIGMEPAVKPAIERNENSRVLVTATPLTLKEEKLKNLIAKLDNEGVTDLLPLPDLVRFAEKFDFSEETVLPYLLNELKGFNLSDYGTIVLGCTHFPLYYHLFKKIFGPEVTIIDGSFGTVNHLKTIIASMPTQTTGTGTVVYYKSGKAVSDKELTEFSQIFGVLKDLKR